MHRFELACLWELALEKTACPAHDHTQYRCVMKHFWTQPLRSRLSEVFEGPARTVEHSPGGPQQSPAPPLSSQLSKISEGPARTVEHSPGGPHQSSATQLSSQ